MIDGMVFPKTRRIGKSALLRRVYKLRRAGFHTCQWNGFPKDSADRDVRPTNFVDSADRDIRATKIVDSADRDIHPTYVN
jgi:hypothetical protein